LSKAAVAEVEVGREETERERSDAERHLQRSVF
jgi:hypothetical protein